jgi:hypothetical protein
MLNTVKHDSKMKKSVTITLSEEVLEKARQIAKQESRSLSQQIEKVLKDTYSL